MELIALFTIISAQYSLPPGLLASLCYTESHYDVSAVHKDDGHTDSIGICQVQKPTAHFMGYNITRKELFDPEVNIRVAAAYLRYQIKRYQGNLKKAVIAYNRGNAKGLTTTKYQVKVYEYWRQQ